MFRKNARSRRELRNIASYTFLAMVFWTGIATAFFAWNVRNERRMILDLAEKEARSSFSRNITFRRWIAKYGGVYVPVTEDTPPSPYLSMFPERDIRTPTGRKLTLMNPAYAFRQLMEMDVNDGVIGHITSLEPIRPENAPDEWERAALHELERGAEEVAETVNINGNPYFHIMRPVYAEKPCLTCHAAQGYREGEVRGGIGIAVPMGQYRSLESQAIRRFSVTYALSWFSGTLLIGFISFRARRQVLERQRSEAALLRSEANLNKAQALAHIGSWYLDIPANVLTWSDEVFRMFGLPAGRLLTYETFLDCVHPEDRERVDRAWKDSLGGKPYDIEHRITAQGTTKWVREIASVVFDEDRRPREGIGTVQDITDRKTADAAIRESEERLRDLFENAPVSLWEEDFSEVMLYLSEELKAEGDDIEHCLDGHPEVVRRCAELVRIRRVNRKALELHGATDEKELLKGLPRTFTRESYHAFRRELIALWRGETSFEADASVNTLTGEPREVIVRLHVPPGQEKTFSRVLVSLYDVTERRKMERFVQQVLENVGEGFAVIDPEYRIITANRVYCDMSGRGLSEITGRHCFAVSHGSDRPCHENGEECPVRHTFKTGKDSATIHTHAAKPGKIARVEIKTFPMKDSEGRVQAVIETINDITERSRLQEQLQQSQKMEAIGHLAGGVAHDFNNLLTAIIGYGNILRNRLAADDAVRPYLDEILASSERAAELTRSLLAFSRKQIISPKPVDLNVVVAGIEKILRRLIGEDVELNVVYSDRNLVALVDKGQIEQVLMNLATNARDAMPTGGTLTIRTSVFHADENYARVHLFPHPGTYACIALSDTGTGMNEQTLEKIFEPFFTTKELGRGTGLGLAIVYGIVKQHNGNINVSSEPGKGSTFTLSFPLVQAPAADEQQPQSPPAGGTETILLAEDDGSVRNLFRTILETAGYTVLTAQDGEEAVGLFREQGGRIGLALLDVVMPRKNGHEAYEEMRAIAPAVKALFISGYTDNIIHQRGILRGDLEFISKPVDPETLLRKMRGILERPS